MLKIGHTVTRPGKKLGDPPTIINVPEELETVPGIQQKPTDVDYYARDFPLDSINIEHSASIAWGWALASEEHLEFRRVHDKLNKPMVQAALESGDIEPTAKPAPGKDVTPDIKNKARELGFNEVGITRMDRRYIFKSKKDWVKFPHAICLAYEQDYEPTQTAPSMEAEGPHFGIYRVINVLAIQLADYLRSLGYHAQIQNPNDNSGACLPMFVEAGLGQLGANGQLLSPYFGSRARLLIVTTDAQVTYDKPVDYGMTAFCSYCQVCVNRCPGRAIPRQKVWWRGVNKHKISYKRCRPVVSKYDGCGVCMSVCPVQRFGMKEVLDHYSKTGHVLGKGTNLLEGYSVNGMGYFGPGELPKLDPDLFATPQGKSEGVIFQELKEKIKAGQIPDSEAGDQTMKEFKQQVERFLAKTSTAAPAPLPDEP